MLCILSNEFPCKNNKQTLEYKIQYLVKNHVIQNTSDHYYLWSLSILFLADDRISCYERFAISFASTSDQIVDYANWEDEGSGEV